ncbi:MAG: flagellar protein FlaG [Phenylobacterium sp.]
MENKINAVPIPPEFNSGQQQAQPATAQDRTELSVPKFSPHPAADLRLVIEPRGSSYVYKTIDRRTGEIVSQYPMEEIVKMMSEQRYTAGVIIRATA